MEINKQGRWEHEGHIYTCGEAIKLLLSDGSVVAGKIESDRIGRYFVQEPDGNMYYISKTDKVKC